MTQAQKLPITRLAFFDNLRSLMVVLVLIFHSGASYGSMVTFWPFHEAKPTEFVDIIMILLDTFMMGILFFIAGYFALPSLQKKGGKRFLGSKFKRLGIPWLIVTILVLPILDYIHYYVQSVESGLSVRNYATHWQLSMKKISELHVGLLDMSQYLDMTEQFYQRYMWFPSLLLLFFILFWLFFEAKTKWMTASERSTSEETTSNQSIYLALSVIGLVTVLLFTLVKFFFSLEPTDMLWFSLGNIFQFQLAKLVFYAPYFVLGVYAYSKKWFTNGRDIGRPLVWGLVCFLLMIANMLIARNLTRSNEPSMWLQLAFVLLYPIWTLSFLGMFTAYAVRRWNLATTLNRKLADNSYNMYLVHYVIVMTLPLLLSTWIAPTLVKFGVVALITIGLSYGISRYILKPYPRWTVIAIVLLFLVLMVIA
jgi:hypothetical protein